MSYSISTTPTFEKQVKKLAKKYPSLKSDLLSLIEKLEENPTQGVELIPNCYKVRIAIASKHKGKSGGARVITYVHIVNQQVYLLSIFDKSEKESISDTEIKDILGLIE
jgi:Cytotoxic translational repressor of toxin-antitoxin stability system